MKRYKLQNSYQDSNWEDIGISYHTKIVATEYAKDLIKDVYGMLRVIDTETNEIIITIPAVSR